MRATGKKRANLARRQRGSRKVFLMTVSLALGALAIGGTCELGHNARDSPSSAPKQLSKSLHSEQTGAVQSENPSDRHTIR